MIMKPKDTDHADNEKELLMLREKLGIDPNISPDRLREVLKQLANNKAIAGYKIKNEK